MGLISNTVQKFIWMFQSIPPPLTNTNECKHCQDIYDEAYKRGYSDGKNDMMAYYNYVLFLIEKPDDDYARVLIKSCEEVINRRIESWNSRSK